MKPAQTPEPSRDFINHIFGAVMLEFGAEWCGYCQAAQDIISQSIAAFPQVEHLRIEDGAGRRLGRSFNIKLWPTLIFLKDGIELNRLVREINSSELTASLALITSQD
jgi:thioredoxin 1